VGGETGTRGGTTRQKLTGKKIFVPPTNRPGLCGKNRGLGKSADRSTSRLSAKQEPRQRKTLGLGGPSGQIRDGTQSWGGRAEKKEGGPGSYRQVWGWTVNRRVPPRARASFFLHGDRLDVFPRGGGGRGPPGRSSSIARPKIGRPGEISQWVKLADPERAG